MSAMHQESKNSSLLPGVPFAEIVRLHIEQNRKIEGWSEDDVAGLLGKDAVKAFLGLPLYLQVASTIIGCGPENYFIGVLVPGTLNQMYCPASSFVTLSDQEGTMNMGWGTNNLVGSDGHFINGSNAPNSWPQPTNNHFLVDPPNGPFNRYCFALRIGNLIMWNQSISSFGASVGSPGVGWGLSDGGAIDTGFNDEDNNNSGQFSQTMTISSVAVTIAVRANSLPKELRSAVMDLLPSHLRRK